MKQSRVGRLAEPVTGRDHTAGSRDASVTFVEYGDYECSYCGHAYRVVKELRETLGDRVLFVFRNFPLGEIHPHAQQAAEAAEAAAAQGQFWAMHDLLYEHQDALATAQLVDYADELDLDVARFEDELRSGTYETRVRDDFIGGARSGVNGTPTFFVAGQRYDEQWDTATLRAALEDAM